MTYASQLKSRIRKFEVHEVTCTYLQQTDPGEDFDRYIRIENRLMAPEKCAVFFLDVYYLK